MTKKRHSLRQHYHMSLSYLACLVTASLHAGLPSSAVAIPHQTRGRMIVQGVTLLQDADRPQDYYYLPQSPRIATHADGRLQLLCMRYLGDSEESSGGIFHVVVECDLSDTLLRRVTAELHRTQPNARIVGPVPMLSMDEDAVLQNPQGAQYRLISSILRDKTLTRSAVTTGPAPVNAEHIAVTASLTLSGTTLLWTSLEGAQSDVSVEFAATYEARVDGYGVHVSADLETVYEHLSTVVNNQDEFHRRHLKKVVDELNRNDVIHIREVDGSILAKSKSKDALVDTITDELIKWMFDVESGWGQAIPREVAVEARPAQVVVAAVFAVERATDGGG